MVGIGKCQMPKCQMRAKGLGPFRDVMRVFLFFFSYSLVPVFLFFFSWDFIELFPLEMTVISIG